MLYFLENDRLKLEVNSLGAELWSIYDKQRKRPLLWQGDPDAWPRRSPTLFPICGKRKSGDLPMHGFIRDYEHTLVEQRKDMLVFVCHQNQQTKCCYPYDFSFYTTYRLQQDTLYCTFEVTNTDTEVLPFSVGFHSGFYANDSSKLVFELAEQCSSLLTNGDGLLCGINRGYMGGRQQVSLQAPLFPSTLLLESPQSRYVDLVTDGVPVLRFGFEGFPYLAIWVNQLPLRFVCIEPWHGLPDSTDAPTDFFKKPALVHLPAGGEFQCTQTITAL